MVGRLVTVTRLEFSLIVKYTVIDDIKNKQEKQFCQFMKKLNVCNVTLIYDLDIAQEKNTTNRLIFVFSLNKRNLTSV